MGPVEKGLELFYARGFEVISVASVLDFKFVSMNGGSILEHLGSRRACCAHDRPLLGRRVSIIIIVISMIRSITIIIYAFTRCRRVIGVDSSE